MSKEEPLTIKNHVETGQEWELITKGGRA